MLELLLEPAKLVSSWLALMLARPVMWDEDTVHLMICRVLVLRAVLMYLRLFLR